MIGPYEFSSGIINLYLAIPASSARLSILSNFPSFKYLVSSNIFKSLSESKIPLILSNKWGQVRLTHERIYLPPHGTQD